MTVFSQRYKIQPIAFVHRVFCLIFMDTASVVQVTMKEQFHLLDLQITLFTEFGVCMIFPGAADLDHLRKTSEKLVEQWPILAADPLTSFPFCYSVKSICF